jgi:hypothetical protein
VLTGAGSNNTPINDLETKKDVNSPSASHNEQMEVGSRITHQRYEILLPIFVTNNIRCDSWAINQTNPEPHAIDTSSKEVLDIDSDVRKQSRKDKPIQTRRKSKHLVMQVGHYERAGVRGDESDNPRNTMMDMTRDEQFTELALSMGGLRRSGRVKQMRTTSPTQEAESRKAKKAKVGEQGKPVSIFISSQLDEETRGGSTRRSRKSMKLSRGKRRCE